MSTFPIIASILRIVATIMNAAMFVCLLYFSWDLRWERESDRSAIIGFTWMLAAIGVSMICIWI